MQKNEENKMQKIDCKKAIMILIKKIKLSVNYLLKWECGENPQQLTLL